jgi:hypothetical protein
MNLPKSSNENVTRIHIAAAHLNHRSLHALGLHLCLSFIALRNELMSREWDGARAVGEATIRRSTTRHLCIAREFSNAGL